MPRGGAGVTARCLRRKAPGPGRSFEGAAGLRPAAWDRPATHSSEPRLDPRQAGIVTLPLPGGPEHSMRPRRT